MCHRAIDSAIWIIWICVVLVACIQHLRHLLQQHNKTSATIRMSYLLLLASPCQPNSLLASLNDHSTDTKSADPSKASSVWEHH